MATDDVNGINVKPEVLKWARESLGIAKNKAAESARIDVSRLNRLEEGREKPSFKEVQALAKAYKRSPMVLLMQTPLKDKPLPQDRRTLNSEEVDTLDPKTIVAVRKARAFATSLVELKQENEEPIPSFNWRAELSEQPNRVADRITNALAIREIREMNNAQEALELAIEKVEASGVAIFQLSLTKNGIRGFSIVDDVIPIIAIKGGGELPTSKLFTLFHELGHILLNEGGLCDLIEKPGTAQIEKWCNAFAAHVLVPSSDLEKVELAAKQLNQGKREWRPMELDQIAEQFHVGRLMILRRLLEHGLTTKAYYQKKHGQWNKTPFMRSKNPEGRQIPKEILKEKGRSYVELAFRAYDHNRIDVISLADYLGVRFSYIPKTRELLKI